MKKIIKWIFRVLTIGIVLGIVGFTYWRWGFKAPEILEMNETFVAGDCEFVIEETAIIPSGFIQSLKGYNPNVMIPDNRKAIDLTIKVKNIGTQDIVLLNELRFSVDQINDPAILQFLHLHFFENYSTVNLYNPNNPEENTPTHRDGNLKTKLIPQEEKKLHFIFICEEVENNTYLLEIGDWSGNKLLYRQLKLEEMTPCSEIATKNVHIQPMGRYQNNNDDGISLKITNTSNQEISLSELMECVAIDEKIWQYKWLDKCIVEGKEIVASEFFLEPNKAYEIHLIDKEFSGSGQFYFRIDNKYYLLNV